MIPFVQVATPNVNVPAYSGWCLRYVDDGVNAPNRQPSAQASWEYAKRTGVAHENQEPPNNVWVPVYYSINSGIYAGLGHVAWYYSDGKTTKIYDSEYGSGRRSVPYGGGAELIQSMGYQMSYLGWSEAVDGKRMVEKVKELPNKPDEKKEVNLDMYIIYNLNNNAHYVCDGFNARWVKTERELDFYLGQDGHNKIKFPYTKMYDNEFRAIYPKPKVKN